MKNILLTLDYELFGNGNGDVFKHIIEPTNILLALAEKYNAKYTFSLKLWNSGNLKKNGIKVTRWDIIAILLKLWLANCKKQ